jgi:lipopolysaccharide transport system permease protein
MTRAVEGCKGNISARILKRNDVTIPPLTRRWQYRNLVRNLIAKDFRVRYQGSILGFLWTLVTPLVMILIYLVAFKYILRVQVPNFGLFLITGILPWTFFSTAVMTSTDSITSNANLLKNIYFPRETLPLSTVLFHFSHLLLAYTVFFPVIIFLHAPLSWALLAFPLLLAMNLVLVLGFALLFSASTVFFVDIRQITDLSLMALFWLTPIVYELGTVPEGLRGWLLYFPMTSIVRGYQDILYSGVWPSMQTWTIGPAWALGMFVIGYTTFRALQPRFAESL